jgi:hypothetical protein
MKNILAFILTFFAGISSDGSKPALTAAVQTDGSYQRQNCGWKRYDLRKWYNYFQNGLIEKVGINIPTGVNIPLLM